MFRETDGWRRWTGGVVGGLVMIGMTVAGLAGCGQKGPTAPTTRLEGAVRLDGQPIPEGIISFIPQQKKQAPPAKGQIRDGRYTADNVPIGPVLVVMSAPKKTGKIQKIPDSKAEYEEVVETIPPKYLAGIPVEVTKDMKTKDFDLSSK